MGAKNTNEIVPFFKTEIMSKKLIYQQEIDNKLL
jgi:hypothetical protein